MLPSGHPSMWSRSPKSGGRFSRGRSFVLGVSGMTLSILVASAGAAGASPAVSHQMASVPAVSAAAPSGAVPNLDKGFDTAAKVSDSAVSCLKGEGYHFGILYVNGVEPDWADTYRAMQKQGMTAILNQGFEDKHLYETASKAQDRGKSNVAAAQSVSYPKGSDIFLDVEQTGSASRSELITWINAWSKEITAAGYVAGVYSGVPSALAADGSDMTASTLPDVKVYWQALSSAAPDPAQGYVAVQHYPSIQDSCLPTSGSTSNLDIDHAYIDKKGNHLYGSGGGNGGTGTPTPAATSSSSAAVLLPNGHLAVGFRAAESGLLWSWNGALNTGGNGTATTVGIAAGTTPSIAVLPNGNLAMAFHGNDGYLWTWTGALDTAGKGTRTADGMAAGTSPSLAVLPDGKLAVAFNANGGKLWTWTGAINTAGNGTATADGEEAGTSPSLAVLGNGHLAVAFQANNSQLLWTWNGALNTTGNGTATYDGMASKTSPSLTVLPNQNLAVAFQANGGKLWTWTGALNTAGNGTATADGMEAGTSPSLGLLGNGHLAVAFHASSSGLLWTWNGALNTTGNGTATSDGMTAGSSPSLAVLLNGNLAVAFKASSPAGTTPLLWTWTGALNSNGNGTATHDGMG